jgi:type II secretory pathway pseudopilin PulG
LIELLVVISIIALLIGLLLPALGAARRTANQLKNTSQLRGQHQGMVIYANSNNFYLPGLDASGKPETNTFGGGTPIIGGTDPSNREWIMLNGNYFTGDLAINPVDASKVRWTSGEVRKSHFSYGMLSIADSATEAGRVAEWKDNANTQAVIMGDRALSGGADLGVGAEVATANIRSVWTTTNGDWKGCLVWGDNHAGFEQKNEFFQTRYLANTTTADTLFLDGDGSTNLTGAEEYNAPLGGNAFLVYY